MKHDELAFSVRVDARFPEAMVEALIDQSLQVQRQRGVCHLMTSGGDTAQVMHRTLAQPRYRDSLDWSRIWIWLGDERPVPPEHPDSNWGALQRNLLDFLPDQPGRALRLRGEALDLDATAAAYEDMLRSRLVHDEQHRPQVDLLVLGLGPDGHTASLFPGTRALAEERRLVVANPVPQLGQSRLTITFPLIEAARHVHFLVAGKLKGVTLREVLRRAPPSDLPAARAARRARNLVWWLDEEAAEAAGLQV